MSTATFVLVTLGLFFGSWLAYDLWIVATVGTESGQTISWVIWTKYKQYPGFGALVIFALGALFAHLFLGMVP